MSLGKKHGQSFYHPIAKGSVQILPDLQVSNSSSVTLMCLGASPKASTQVINNMTEKGTTHDTMVLTAT